MIRVGSQFQATVPACAHRARIGEEADARVGSTVWDPAAVTETEGPPTATTRRPARRACPAPRALRSVADRRSCVVLQSTSSWSSLRPSAIRISSPPTQRSPCCIGTRTSRAPPWPSSSAVRPPPPASTCGPLFAELASLRTEEAELPDTTPLDQWSEDDIQNFEDGVERYGKNFFKVHGHMQGKYSVEMLVLFYYARWKKSAGFKCWLARRSKEDEEELQECVSCGKPESEEGEGPGIMLLCDNCPAAFHAVCCHPKPSYASTFAQTASPACS